METVTVTFTGNEVACLLGAVGRRLQDPALEPRQRKAFLALRDRLAPLVEFDDEVAAALGLDRPEQRH